MLDTPQGEAALIEGLRARDGAAFERMVRAHLPALLAVARRLVRTPADADEVVQEAFLSAYRNFDQFRADAKLRTWLHRIVVNTALQRLRHDQRRPQETQDLTDLERLEVEGLLPDYGDAGQVTRINGAWTAPTEELLQRQETRQRVRRMIDQLPETHRVVLILRDIEELSTQEAAEALGVSVSVVKTRLHRARMALRELIAADLAAATGPQQEADPA